ncbi:MAG: DNA primase [Rhodospirillales bacterium]|nr:DNA primase [Rhodospirillales bacterium]
MAFSPAFLDEIRTRVPLSDIVGKQVRLQRNGPEFKGLCPFHREKTPSFTVSEQKGFYHCFGCGAHGDVIGFVMRTENLSFPEAVERLAGLAGVEMPRQTPDERERERRAATLHDVLDEACRWFEEQLMGPDGAKTRAYLDRRGVTRETGERFRLGFAPDGRNRLIRHLRGKGVPPQLIAGAGLSAGGDGREPIDCFRHRLIFPIADRGGRIIAFGGRTMGDHPAKYINSPETDLFHKGMVLYGYAQARKPAHEAGTVIVAEGYMDVIALAQAGFCNAVAPLGTALTEGQLALLWRIADEPVLCFDGDAAGQRAAVRALERALLGLEPGRSLNFAMLPDGLDPDGLIKARGLSGMKQVLDRAIPLLDMLWRSRVEGGRFDTPERRAALDKELHDCVARIGNPNVRHHYKQAVRDRLRESFGPARFGRPTDRRDTHNRPGRRTSAYRMEMERKPSRLPDPVGDHDRSLRLLLGLPLVAPGLLERIAERLVEVTFNDPRHDRLRDSMLDALSAEEILDSESLHRHLTAHGLTELLGDLTGGAVGGSADPSLCVATVDEAELLWHHAFELLQQHRLKEEIEADAVAWAEDASNRDWRRLQAKQEMHQASEKRVVSLND